jgi:hypothetical protein
VKLFNERLLSEGKAEKIQGWQLILDNPTCFLSDATEIAKTEISDFKISHSLVGIPAGAPKM